MSYKHLTLQERYLINAYKHIKTQKEIAKMVGVHPSTISRELKRGRGKTGKDYWVIDSHNKALKRQIEKSKKSNLKLTAQTIKLIKKYLQIEYSPEQIAATLTLKYHQPISHVTIYKYIYINRLAEGKLYKQLRHTKVKDVQSMPLSVRVALKIEYPYIKDQSLLKIKQD